MTDSTASLVSTAKLTRRYQLGNSEVVALRDVSLEVGAGEFLGIVGVSGSGKSTLLHLLGGLDKPTSGHVRVGHHQLESMSRHELTLFRRQTVGFVFQAFYLVPTLTAAANLCAALTFQGLHGTQRKQLASEALARVGLAQRGFGEEDLLAWGNVSPAYDNAPHSSASGTLSEQ